MPERAKATACQEEVHISSSTWFETVTSIILSPEWRHIDEKPFVVYLMIIVVRLPSLIRCSFQVHISHEADTSMFWDVFNQSGPFQT